MTPNEQRIRDQLGVPGEAEAVLILGMDAHMDWDWLDAFQALVDVGPSGESAARKIIQDAWGLMIEHPGPKAPYRYSVCEMGFLRAVMEGCPGLLARFRDRDLGAQLGIAGGGITSPDSLLPHGEAFLRNYLLGRAWSQQTLGLASTFAYVPDDFGHDAQLPTMLEALGFSGVSFSRIPGSWPDSNPKQPLGGGESLYQAIMKDGVDFDWKASDGSSVLAHLEQDSYCQGNSLSQLCGHMNAAVSALSNFLNDNQPSSPSPYVYLPCGCDFALPIPCLPEIADAWNRQPGGTPSAWCVVGTLGQYLDLVRSWSEANPGILKARAFDPTPYWTGFYASRPALKILHQATVRALLGAEVFGSIADVLMHADELAWSPVKSARREAVARGWEALVPSTHHDYITGTAVDAVYTQEQLPLLRAAHAIALGARSTAVEEVATVIGANPAWGEIPVAVFNQLGFDRAGLVEIEPRPGPAPRSVRASDGKTGPVQVTAEGRLMFAASAPSLGYDTYYLSDEDPGPGAAVSMQVSPTGETVTIANGRLQVVLDRDKGWAVTSLRPIIGGQRQADLVPEGGVANALVFYEDRGNLYNFGNESLDPADFQVVCGSLVAGTLRVLESGPLRARVEAQVAFDDNGSSHPVASSATYILQYTLVAGEPMLRMSVSGTAPLPADPGGGGTPYSVVVRFPFADEGGAALRVDSVLRGTPYHWDEGLPVPYWSGPTFQATHHFLVPGAGGKPLAALYHADIPAWAIDSDGAMIGCILRNTPGSAPWPTSAVSRGANGVDFGNHARSYALRIPQGFDLPPSSSEVFRESHSFATPLLGAYVNVPSNGVTPTPPVQVQFPARFSLAGVSQGDAIVTAAKSGRFEPGNLILRLYQPSNTGQTVRLDLSGYLMATRASSPRALPVTALEQPIAGAATLPVTGGCVSIAMERALATIAITPNTACDAEGDPSPRGRPSSEAG